MIYITYVNLLRRYFFYMAMLATLEGNEKGIDLNDLFDVNDFLGIKYFGPEDWNRVKKCACIITQKAANNPVLFYIDSLKEDYPTYKESELSKCVFGFNDAAGCELMGSIPWNRLKVKLDNDLLGWSITGAVKGAAKGVSSAGKAVVSAPQKAISYAVEETPLKYVPGVALTAKAYDTVLETPRDIAASAATASQDIYSKAQQAVWTETPLKYTPGGWLVSQVEQGKEEAGILTPGTAGVYDSPETAAAKEEAARRAKLTHAGQASAQAAQFENVTRATQLAQAKAEQAKAAAAQAIAEQQATEQALNVAEGRLESKYAPIIIAGCVGLLALSIIKGK